MTDKWTETLANRNNKRRVEQSTPKAIMTDCRKKPYMVELTDHLGNVYERAFFVTRKGADSWTRQQGANGWQEKKA